MSELYLFQGATQTYGFTPRLRQVIFNSVTYAPTIVKRTSLNLEDNFAKNNVNFSFIRSHFYAKELLLEIPEEPILCTIYRSSGVTYTPYWKGRVIGAEARTAYIDILCDSIYSSLKRGGLSPKIGLLCRHSLYSENCSVAQGLWTVTYSVSASSSEIFVSGMTQPAGYFNNGIATMGGQSRRIVSNSATHIHLAAPFSKALTGTIGLAPGCLLTQDACDNFNNGINFGGFDQIPNKNPFGGTGLL